MRRGVCALFFLMVFSVVFASRASCAEKAVKKIVKASASRAVFDLAHGEVFTPLDPGALNYSIFYNSFREEGWELGINKERISAKVLNGVTAYVIAGPMQPVDDSEIAALQAFVNNGGRLLVLLHISDPAAQLCESFGILVTNYVIAEPQDNIDGASQDFYVTRLTKHPVTDGVSRVAVYGAWGLAPGGHNGMMVARTSDRAWADLNRNRAFDAGEPVQEFGIIGISKAGKGRVVVVADDAPFANKFINVADNGRLAGNIIGWFARQPN